MDCKTFITIVLGIISFFFTVFKYFDTKKREQDLREFETYHRLIKELVQSDNEDKSMYADRQVAIVFELKNFKRYYDLSQRILTGLKDEWKNTEGKYTRLLHELDLTIDFLEKKAKNKAPVLF